MNFINIQMKEIQEQRMRAYFIESTKGLLRSEGLKSVNVRSVAENAGYSYATLYNYFKDLNELIFECVKDFQGECETLITAKTGQLEPGKGKIAIIVQEYITYFTEYPGIFELFFTERMTNMGKQKSTSELIYTFLDRLCEEEWTFCINHGQLTTEEVAGKKKQLRYAVMGLLLFYLHRMQPDSYADFSVEVNEQVNKIIG